ncbi:MAG: FecR domain-containing protein [Pseudomonas sp.]|nr:FecR domain-containing protein [Pseudomonas sp.]
MYIFNRRLVVFLASFLIGSSAYSSAVQNEGDFRVNHHIVVPGDTLWDLSEKYLGNPLNYKAVKQLNNIDNERLLKPGKELSFISARFYPGIVTAVTGHADLVKGKEKSAINTGALIEAGNLIQAFEQSFVKLRFMNQVQVEISPNSVVFFNSVANNTVNAEIPKFNLQQGNIELQVPPAETEYNKLEVMTPYLTLGVRGTRFRVKQDARTTINEVLKGTVILTEKDQDLALVVAGDGAVFDGAEHVLLQEKLGAEPAIRRAFYDKQGLHIEIEPDQKYSLYKIKIYNDKDYTVPLQELVSHKSRFLIAPEFVTDQHYFLSATTYSLAGLESYPSFYIHDLSKVTVVPIERGVEFNFPYCDTQWRIQLAESQEFLIPAVDRSTKGSCKIVVNNLPELNWYWRVFEGNHNDKDFAAGQVNIFRENKISL